MGWGIPSYVLLASGLVGVLLIASALVRRLGTDHRFVRTNTSTAALVKEFGAASTKFYNMYLQDAHFVVAFLHLNFAIANINAARRVAASDAEVQRLTNLNPKEWVVFLEERQAAIISRLNGACPTVFSENPFAVHAGWRNQ